MVDMNEISFCPSCEKLLHYKEDFEKVQLWLACSKCGYKKRASDAVVYFKEYPDYEEEKEPIPITKEVRCPHCGHGQAGFFEEWIQNKPNIARPGAASKSPLGDLSEEIFDSDSDEEEIAKWKKERLRLRRKAMPDEKNPEAMAKWEEKLKAEEMTKRAEIQRRKKRPVKPEARRALIFVCLNNSCGKTWEGD